MGRPFQAADFGQEEDLWQGEDGKMLFQRVVIDWSRPKLLARNGTLSIADDDEVYKHGYLYAIVRNHWNQKDVDRIAYFGITNDLSVRFKNHPKVDSIRAQQGETSICLGRIKTPGRRLNEVQAQQLREEIEHILIWVLWEHLWNDKKTWTVPSQGRNGGLAWDIRNVGHKFRGRMPERIVFPWAVVVPRKNNTRR